MRVASPAPGGTGRLPRPWRDGLAYANYDACATLTGPTLRANLASRIAGLFARTDAKIRRRSHNLPREGRKPVRDALGIRDRDREFRLSAALTGPAAEVASLTGLPSPLRGGTN